ncbi:hypothetical protein [Ekhidna sp.]
MKPLITTLLSLIILISSQQRSLAQGKEVTLDTTQFTISILPLMAHLEAKVGEKQSVTFGGGLAYSFYFQSINGEESFESYSTPFLTASFRNYYNRKRIKKDNLKNNSGNYVGLYSSYQFNTIVDAGGFGTFESDLNGFTVGPVWGIQRNYASGIHLDISVGLGYTGFESDDIIMVDNKFGIIGGFEFGFRFN